MDDLKLTGKSVSSKKPVILLELDGFIDGNTSGQLKTAMTNFINKNINYVIIDCTKLLYMSSAGFGVFIGLLDLFQNKKGEFVITCISDKIFDIFETLGLNQIIKFFKSNDEAIEYFDKL